MVRQARDRAGRPPEKKGAIREMEAQALDRSDVQLDDAASTESRTFAAHVMNPKSLTYDK